MKLVKARCTISNKKVALQVDDDGGKVLGIMRISDQDYGTMESQVYLKPNAVCVKGCPSCGSTKVAGCDHKYRTNGCNANSSPTLDCACCNKLEPDYGAAAGGVNPLQMKRGEIARIPLSKLLVGLNWERSRNGDSIDIDSSVVLCGQGGDGYELIYFGNLNSRDYSVHHLGDNLTGDAGYVSGAIDKENIEIDLGKVSSAYTRMVFVVNIYRGASNLGSVPGFEINIKDRSTGRKLIGYTVDNGYEKMQSMVIGVARRCGSGWEFKAVGEGTHHDKVNALAEHVARTTW